MALLDAVLVEIWEMLFATAPYLLGGLLFGGLVKTFLSPDLVARHLGRGRVGPVWKAALLGLPLPLCSCGVLPAAAALRNQGASRGAVTSFLIATPETGLDSLALTYALMDPLMTAARPLAALATALGAGLAESLTDGPGADPPRRTLPPAAGPASPPGGWARLRAGLGYALGELWSELAGWFWLGIVLAGVVAALVPDDFLARHLGGGPGTMLVMLAVGVPLYICASASTPIAAALMLKGLSPGAALVFLLAGPATNLTSLTVLVKVLGKRGTAIYLAAIAVGSLTAGLLLDQVYPLLGIDPRASLGAVREVLPAWVHILATAGLGLLSLRELFAFVGRHLARRAGGGAASPSPACGCAAQGSHRHPGDGCGCGHGHA